MADFLMFVSEQWPLVSLLLALLYLFLFLERRKAGAQISVHEVTRLLNGGEALLVDLRDAREYEAGHIHQAVNIPQSQLAARLSELEPFRGRILVLIDKLGHQSASAGRQLGRAGFQVRRLQGGMAEWRAQSLPVVS